MFNSFGESRTSLGSIFFIFKRSKYSIKRLDILDNLYNSFNYFLNKKEEEIAFIILKDYIDNILKEYKNICIFKIKNKEIKKDILKRYKKEYMLVVRKCNLNFISKVKYIIYRYIPKLYILLSKFTKRIC